MDAGVLFQELGRADIQKVIMARRIGIGRATKEQSGVLA